MIRCIVIDDEPVARKGLKEYISEIDFLELAGEFDHPVKAAAALPGIEADLLFLDIQMPKMSGLEFLKSLPIPPAVILVTAYPEYALEGFEVNAIDYLVKPVSFERFFKAAQRAREYFEVRNKNLPAIGAVEPGYFFIKADNVLVKVMHADILYAEALQNYIAIQTTQKKYISYLTFHALEAWLPPSKFLRTHKSFIVAADKIDSIDGNDIRIGQHHVPISRNMKEEVMEKLLNGKFLKR